MIFTFFLTFFTLISILRHYWECNVYLYRIIFFKARIDSYALAFFCLLSIISFSVRLWAYYYIGREGNYTRFYGLLIVFISSIVLLILISNLFMALIGWDCLGLTSFLLVVYYKNRQCLGSGYMTALSNRIGDCLLFCCIGLFLYSSRTLFLVFLSIMRMTKRAQIPFSSWLPAAMAAPTPVRALVHSSTLVTAGVYIMIRYRHQDNWVMLWLGRCTLVTAGLRACAERDLKKVVALSTLSQLGVMIFAVGANEKSFCFFHLLSHACFKALLFMCVGVYIHILYGTQEQRRLNNLAAAIPAASFISLAVLSLMGFLFTSGFYRKDSILESIYRGESHGTAILLFLLGIGLTTFYSIKILLRTILNPAFSLVSTASVSALRLYVKLPVYILGFFRVAFGINVGDYRSGLTLVINRIDKQLTIVMISFGLLAGYLVNNLNRLKLRSLLCISPATWYLAYVPGIVGKLDKEIERTCRGAMVFPSMVLAIQPALVTLGLSVFIWIIMFYVEYFKSKTLRHYAVRWWYNH